MTLNQKTTCTKLLATFAPSGRPGWVESGYHLHPEQKFIQKGELLFLVGGSRSLSALTEIQTLDTEILPKLCLPARMPWRLFLASTRNQRFKHACACFLPSSLLLNILLTNYPFSFLLLFSEMGTYTAYVVTYWHIDTYSYIIYILSFFCIWSHDSSRPTPPSRAFSWTTPCSFWTPEATRKTHHECNWTTPGNSSILPTCLASDSQKSSRCPFSHTTRWTQQNMRPGKCEKK